MEFRYSLPSGSSIAIIVFLIIAAVDNFRFPSALCLVPCSPSSKG